MRIKIKKPLVSIIMPVYNSSQFVSKAIKSVLAQSYSRIELIVIEDCSTDQSKQVLQQIEADINDNRLQIQYLESNQGVSYARNLGIQLAKGKYITFVDSDDWIDSTYIEQLVKSLDFNINQDIKPLVISSYIEEYENLSDSIVFDIYALCTLKDLKSAVALLSCPWGKLYQKSFIEKINLKFDETQKTGVEDIQFVIKYLLELDRYMREVYETPCTVYYNKLAKLHWRHNSNGLTATKDAFTDCIKVFKDLYLYVKYNIKFTDDLKNEYIDFIHGLYLKQVDNWQIKRTIKLNGTYKKALYTLSSIDSLTGIEHSRPTIEKFKIHKSIKDLAIYIKDCIVFLIDTKTTNTEECIFKDSHIMSILNHVNSNINWHIIHIYTAAKFFVSMPTNANLLNIDEAISYMLNNNINQAIVLNPLDFMRSQYFNNFKYYINTVKDSICLIPECRTQINGTSITTEVDKVLNIKNLKDLVGSLIILRNSTNLKYIQTDNLCYIQNYYMIHRIN